MKNWTDLKPSDSFYRYDIIRNRVSKCVVEHTYRDSGINFLIYDDEGNKRNQRIQDARIDFTRNESNSVIFFEELNGIRTCVRNRNNDSNRQIAELR